ncbi:MAG: competence/damage-inducible protein A [Candidatus Marinimicrobia bacterium]|nr:competence/damage-inducible protein A [Candidatus Neomarinimicrobiota bacterium]
MNACIISIGDELLSGSVVNSNSLYLANQLRDFGISLKKILTVGDNEKDIIESLESCKKSSNIVFITGGLGATHDDVTKNAVAKYFNSQLLFHEDIIRKIRAVFEKRSQKMPDVNKVMAYIPDNAVILPNTLGTAQGMRFEKDETIFYVMPGVPAEMKQMFGNVVSQELKKISNKKIKTKIIHTALVPESELYSKLENWIKKQSKIKISILPRLPEVDVSLTTDSVDGSKLLQNAANEVKVLLGNAVYAYDSETLEQVIGKILSENHKTIAVAESCTGGMIANRLTNISGSSQYFKMGIVTYCNESKSAILGVKENALKKYGAVSKETALEMAEGVRKISGCDIGLSSTGIAGPLGGSKLKPVGTIFIGLSLYGFSETYHKVFTGNRETNKLLFSQYALNQLRLVLHCR